MMLTWSYYARACDYHYPHISRHLDPSSILKGSKVFVARYYLDTFIQEIFPKIVSPIVVVTANGNRVLDEAYIPFLEHPNVQHCFAVHATLLHPKITCLPLGWPDSLKHLCPQVPRLTYFDPKDIPLYCNWTERHHPQRKELAGNFPVTARKPFSNYIEDVKRAEFVLCPQGHTPDCNRPWEALLCGSIPVVQDHGINSLYEGLPVIIVADLGSVTIPSLRERKELLELGNTSPSRTCILQLGRLKSEFWTGQFTKY